MPAGTMAVIQPLMLNIHTNVHVYNYFARILIGPSLFKRGFIHRKSTKNLIIPINRRLKIDIKRESLLETVAGKGDLLGKHVVCLYINIT